MSTCQTCGKDFTGGYVKHAIKDHPRKVQNPTPTGVTGGDLAIEWDEHDIAHAVITHTPTRESRSPVRTAAKAQVKTPKRVTTPRPSAASARRDARNAVPARERELRAELRQARRAMRRVERELVDVRA